jgi:hypothetical protein
MKTLIALLLMAIPALADVTKYDVKKLLDAGISENVITEYIKTNAPVRMTADDLASLKTAGASDKVLTVLAQYMSSEAPRTETIYVYRTYYNGWYWGGWCWYYRPYYYRVYRPVVVIRPVVRPAPARRGGHR